SRWKALTRYAGPGIYGGGSRSTTMSPSARCAPSPSAARTSYSWPPRHQLTLTKPRPADLVLVYPRYIAGENPAPPEDCGGITGFYAQLEALADPNHPDHDDAKDWFGDYDPNRLDEQPIKDRLARIANRRRTTPAKTKPR